MRGDDVGAAVAVEVGDREVLVEAAGEVALAVEVAAGGAALVGGEAGEGLAGGVEGVDDVGGAAVGGGDDEVEVAVAVEVAGGEAAELVLPGDREAREEGAGGVEEVEALAGGEGDLEARGGVEVGDDGAGPDPAALGDGLPAEGAVAAPDEDGVAARGDDLRGAVAVEVSDGGGAEPGLFPSEVPPPGAGSQARPGGPPEVVSAEVAAVVSEPVLEEADEAPVVLSEAEAAAPVVPSEAEASAPASSPMQAAARRQPRSA